MTRSICLLLALSYCKERAATMAYPLKNGVPDAGLALWTLSYDFYVKIGSTLTWDGKVFNRKPTQVGANAGYSIIKDPADIGITVEPAPGDVNNLGKLVSNRIEAYAGQSLFVDQLRERAMFKGIEKLEPPIVRTDCFLVFSNGFYASSADTAQKPWRQVKGVKKSHGALLDKKYRGPAGNNMTLF